MTAFRAAVLAHFRHPRNRGPIESASASAEGANPLCGDRVRMQLRVSGDLIVDVGFTADACAICIASASVLTEHVRGLRLRDLAQVTDAWIAEALDGHPPPARARCLRLPLDTLRRAAAVVTTDR